jgi:hypothetical protein
MAPKARENLVVFIASLAVVVLVVVGIAAGLWLAVSAGLPMEVPPQHPDSHRTQDGLRRFASHGEIIRVNGSPDVTLKARRQQWNRKLESGPSGHPTRRGSRSGRSLPCRTDSFRANSYRPSTLMWSISRGESRPTSSGLTVKPVARTWAKAASR